MEKKWRLTDEFKFCGKVILGICILQSYPFLNVILNEVTDNGSKFLPGLGSDVANWTSHKVQWDQSMA